MVYLCLIKEVHLLSIPVYITHTLVSLKEETGLVTFSTVKLRTSLILLERHYMLLEFGSLE